MSFKLIQCEDSSGDLFENLSREMVDDVQVLSNQLLKDPHNRERIRKDFDREWKHWLKQDDSLESVEQLQSFCIMIRFRLEAALQLLANEKLKQAGLDPNHQGKFDA